MMDNFDYFRNYNLKENVYDYEYGNENGREFIVMRYHVNFDVIYLKIYYSNDFAEVMYKSVVLN
jgi:hypothetical protein